MSEELTQSTLNKLAAQMREDLKGAPKCEVRIMVPASSHPSRKRRRKINRIRRRNVIRQFVLEFA